VTTTDFSAHVRGCRSCGASIIWARTLHGKSMPVNAEPASGGNILLENRQGFVLATLYSAEMAANLLGPESRASLRQSHFATCPDAKGWRHRA
jgi:hypothetical protein